MWENDWTRSVESVWSKRARRGGSSSSLHPAPPRGLPKAAFKTPLQKKHEVSDRHEKIDLLLTAAFNPVKRDYILFEHRFFWIIWVRFCFVTRWLFCTGGVQPYGLEHGFGQALPSMTCLDWIGNEFEIYFNFTSHWVVSYVCVCH